MQQVDNQQLWVSHSIEEPMVDFKFHVYKVKNFLAFSYIHLPAQYRHRTSNKIVENDGHKRFHNFLFGKLAHLLVINKTEDRFDSDLKFASDYSR